MTILQISAELKETNLQLRRIATALEWLVAIQVEGKVASQYLKRRWGVLFPPLEVLKAPQPPTPPAKLTQPTDEELWETEQKSGRARMAEMGPENPE